MKDIVKKLKNEARSLSTRCTCDRKDCILCQPKILMAKAVEEIEELRKSRSTNGDLLSK